MNAVYLLDANVLIEAHRNYYAFDIAPSFWDRINQQAHLGVCAIIDRVYQEIVQSEDALSKWVRNTYQGDIVTSSTPGITSAYSKIIGRVQADNQFKESAKREFAQCADSWLVAHGVAHNACIVTREVPADSKKKVKIPNECNKYGVIYITPFDFLRKTGVTL